MGIYNLNLKMTLPYWSCNKRQQLKAFDNEESVLREKHYNILALILRLRKYDLNEITEQTEA